MSKNVPDPTQRRMVLQAEGTGCRARKKHVVWGAWGRCGVWWGCHGLCLHELKWSWWSGLDLNVEGLSEAKLQSVWSFFFRKWEVIPKFSLTQIMFEFVYYKGTYPHNGGGCKREWVRVMISMRRVWQYSGAEVLLPWARQAARKRELYGQALRGRALLAAELKL